ncbi:MAG: hypothetical protein ACOYEV_15360 [Candidatus Nanopelagicales bacterium]
MFRSSHVTPELLIAKALAEARRSSPKGRVRAIEYRRRAGTAHQSATSGFSRYVGRVGALAAWAATGPVADSSAAPAAQEAPRVARAVPVGPD